MIKKIMFLLIAIPCILYGSEFKFNVSPTRIDIDLNKKSINEVILFNNGEEALRFVVSTESAPGYEGLDLNEEIELYPKLIKIDSKKMTKLKFVYTPKKVREDKAHKSYIIFKELPKSGDSKKEGTIIYNEVGISVYGK